METLEKYCRKQKDGHDAYCNKLKDHTDRHWYRSYDWWFKKGI